MLTAHPTEVQRKSILDAERAIAELLEQRDALHTERERAENEALIRARVTQLWQTRMLRTAKLTVADEIENALSYYRSTFLRQIPQHVPRARGRPARPRRSRRSSAWATGSAATATATPSSPPQTLQMALARQSETALRFYLTEVHELGAELSISATLAPVTADDAGARRRARPTTARTARTNPIGAR